MAVITGAASGIGLAACELFRGEGWDVVGVDREPSDDSRVLQIDLSSEADILDVLESVTQVDALVNNAAVQHFESIVDTTAAAWDSVFAVNARGPFLTLRTLRERLIERRGAVVNVASVHASATSRSISAYAASKGALLAFTRAAALEMAEHGVRVNAVLPGATDTPALRAGLSRRPDAEARLVAETPLGRIGEPREVAQSILFLADHEKSSYITGQQITVDGGVLARLSTE